MNSKDLRVTALPEHVTVFVNWACNLRCRQCWLYGDSRAENQWLNEVRGQQLDFGLFEKMVDELLSSRSILSISVMGGEPFLFRDLERLGALVRTRAPNSHLDVSTNGMFVFDRHIRLPEYLSIAYFSLDGAKPQTNDPIRGGGTFQAVTEGIGHYQALQSSYSRLRVGINFTVTSANYRELPKMVQLAERLRVDELSVNFAMFFNTAEGTRAQNEFTPLLGRDFVSWRGFLNDQFGQEVDPAQLEASLIEAEAGVSHIRLLIAPTRYGPHEKANYFTASWPGQIRERGCPRLTYQTTLLPNGDIISCTPFADTVMGNLREQSLGEIWHGERYRRFRQHFTSSLSPICYRCCDLNNDMDVDPSVFASVRL